MGLSLGGSYGSSDSSSKSSGTQANTYTAGQSNVQDSLAAAFKTMLPGIMGGGITPNVVATQTQGADTINKSYAGLGDRMTKFLAARGFGSSGESGKVQLQTELGRQGDLAANNSNAAALQLGQNSNWLQKALDFAFSQIGATGSSTGSGSSSGWNFGAGVSAKVPGFG